jgi:outer membrane protein assembly factor BamB
VLGGLVMIACSGFADWPVFRGNAMQTGVAEAALPNPLAVLWKFDAKSFEATAVIADGVVYVGCQDQFFYALNLADGKPKWKYDAKAPIKIAAAIGGGAVYVGDEDGKLHCLDAATGARRWMFDTEAEITSAPNFDGNRVLFGCGDEKLYCLDRDKGGKPLWTFPVPGGPVMGSPAVIDNKTFVAGCDSILHVIDTKTGKEIKAIELDGQVGATPAVAGDFLYIGTMSNQVQAVNLKEGKVAWSYESKNRPQPFFASMAVSADLVLAGSRDKAIHALDRQTGARKWLFPTGGRIDSSPVVAGKYAAFGSNDGKLYVVDLASGQQIQAVELGKSILASAAVSGERLVIGTLDGALYCLGRKS